MQMLMTHLCTKLKHIIVVNDTEEVHFVHEILIATLTSSEEVNKSAVNTISNYILNIFMHFKQSFPEDL
jgi:hypothetical protein